MSENKVQIVVEVDAKTGQATIRQLGEEMDTAGKKGASGFGRAASGADGLRQSIDQVTGLAVKLGLTMGAMEISTAIVRGTIAVERMSLALHSATGSSAQAASELAFVREEANRLGLDMLAVGKGFTGLTAAAKGTRLEGQGIRDIFSAMAEAAAVLSMGAEETKGSLLAIEQMISKGKVSREELRLQLGERLPGAFQIAARAMGVTTQELDQLLEKGEVMTDQFLPRLATELRKTFGSNLETAVGRSEAAFNRLDNAILDMEVTIGNSGLISFLASAAELSSKIIQGLTFLGKAPGTELAGIKLFANDRAKLKEFMNADLLQRQKMVALEERLLAARAKNAAILDSQTKTGVVLEDGALALEFRSRNLPDDKADKIAEKMRDARRQWENKADLAGLTGVEEQLKKIGQEADELRQKFGNAGWIDAGQTERENAAIRADLEKTTEKMTEARSEYEKKTDLAGLEGIHKELKEIGQEAAGLREIYGDQGWIDTWQAATEQDAIAKDHLKEQKDELEKLARVRDAYHQAMIASLPEEQQAVARVTDEYRKQQIAVLDALNAGEISADEAWARSEALSQRETEATRKALDNLRSKNDEMVKIWDRGFENMQDITGDWLEKLDISWDSAGALFKKMTAQMVNAWLWGQAQMKWAGPAGVMGAAGSQAGGQGGGAGGTSALGTGAGIWNALTSTGSLSGMALGGLSGISSMAYNIGLDSVGNLAFDAANWMSGLSSGLADGLTAGVGSLAISLLSGQGLTAQTGLQAAGAALGGAFGGPLGAVIGGMIGNYVGGLFGKGGGASVGGSAWSTGEAYLPAGHTSHQSDIAMQATAATLASTVNRLTAELGGAAADLQLMLGFSTDPEGDSPSAVMGGVRDAAGQQLYLYGHQDVGRDEASLTAALDLEAKRVILVALQVTDLNAFVDPILDNLDLKTISADAADQAMVFVEAADQILAAFGALGVSAAGLASGVFDADKAASLVSGDVWAVLSDSARQAVRDGLAQSAAAFTSGDLAAGQSKLEGIVTAVGQIAAALAPIQEAVDIADLTDYQKSLRSLNQQYAQYRSTLAAAGIDLERLTILTTAYNRSLLDLATDNVATAAAAYMSGLETELDRLQDNVDTTRDRYIGMLTREHDALDDLTDTLGNSINSIRRARKNLYDEGGSILPGRQQQASIEAEINRIMAIALGGDPKAAADAMAQIEDLSGEYVSVSKSIQTDWRDYARDLAKINNLLDVTETQAVTLKSDAQLQIDRLDLLKGAVDGATETALTIDEARRQYEQAVYELEASGIQSELDVMTSLYGTAKSIEQLLAEYLAATLDLGKAQTTAGRTGEWVQTGDWQTWTSTGGAVGQAPAGATSLSQVEIVGVNGQQLNAQAAVDEVNRLLTSANGDPAALRAVGTQIYNASRELGVSAADLDLMMGWAPDTANNAVESWGLERFDTGGSFVANGPSGVDNLSLPGLRVSPGEMVHVSRPDTMAELRSEIRSLRLEVEKLRVENNQGNKAIATHTEKTASVMKRSEQEGFKVWVDEPLQVEVVTA